MNLTADNVFVFIFDWFRRVLEGALPGWAASLIFYLLIALVLIVFGIVVVLALTYMERKIIARVGDRIGPNRAGPLGIFQAVADAIKMLIKEDTTPAGADRWLFLLAPILIMIPAVLLYSVIPFGRNMIATDLSIGVVFVIALGGISSMAVLMAGWGSNNKYALLGGFRGVAQLISYEVPMVLSILTVVLLSETMSTYGIVEAQSTLPFVLVIPVAFLVYIMAGMAEVNRSPFDLMEADSEIVAGYHVEYSGMKFALFFLAEYINMFTVAALVTTLFLGGWQWPLLPSWLWFFIKTFVVIFVMMWIRDTFPRIRIDQVMDLAWKVLVPVSLANLFFVGLVLKLVESYWPRAIALLGGNVVLIAATLLLMGRSFRKKEQRVRANGEAALRRYYGELKTD